MADLAKYQQEFQRFNTEYVKEAVKEPVNFWGLAGFAVAAAYTGSVIPLFIALLCEIAYVLILPALPAYRQLVNNRRRERNRELAKAKRKQLINSFTPREREAVEYLKWQKDKILDNYSKFTGARELPTNLGSLEQRWEDFVDLLDVYRRRKQHLKSINRQAVHNQLAQAFRAAENAPAQQRAMMHSLPIQPQIVGRVFGGDVHHCAAAAGAHAGQIGRAHV